MSTLPRILLCAPASGGGKTTVTCALLRALVAQGKNPVAFKCGPDYIDPMFHSEVIGAKSRNLDLFFLGEERARALLLENGRTGGLAVIEGVMGYYDGIGMGSTASAWDLQQATRTPAVLVVDARGRSISAAALIKGFAQFRENSGIQAVLLNRISPMLYPRLKACIEEETGLPVLGYLPEMPDCALESRHLGLVTAAEVENLRHKLDLLAAQAEKSLDIPGLLALAETAPPLDMELPPVEKVTETRPKIAIARDKAFCFYYADGLHLLEKLGAELVPFSPLTDPALPEDTAALYLGGGYPELYGAELSANASMRAAIRAAVQGGMPTIAECGGFLYLHRELEDKGGTSWPMADVFPFRAYPTPRLTRFGYVTLTPQAPGLLGDTELRLPAHEFHYWESEDPGHAFHAQKPQSQRGWDCAYMTDTLYAGFPHFHLCAVPQAAARFVAAAAAYQATGGTEG
jgi:cobyrinic acid a,c-diamide synthase